MIRKLAVGSVAVISIAAVVLITTPAYAGQWMQDTTGWWWQEDDGTYPAGRWMWLDGNHDGMAEHYYFGPDGYMLANATALDGQQVNENGAWVINGLVQTEKAEWVDNSTYGVPVSDEEYADFMRMVKRVNGNGGGQMDGDINGNVVTDHALEEIEPYELAYRIVEMINEERESRGKVVLEINHELMENAMVRAKEANEYYSHMRPDGRNYNTAVTVPYALAGENLAGQGMFKSDTLEKLAMETVNGWMQSPGHKKNLLDSRWRETGVGIYIIGDKYFVSQLFIK